MSLKIRSLMGAGLLSVSALAVTAPASANSFYNSTNLVFGDPVPPTDPSVCHGLSYEWTVQLGKPSNVSFVRAVGAKSWNEPPPGYNPPETGWTHTSDWVAFELKKPAKVTIQIARQQGVLLPSIVTDPTSGSPALAYTLAGDKLYPAFSLYKGWEVTGCEDHRYDNSGDQTNWFQELEFLANQPNTAGWSKSTLTKYLPAGKYSIAIGGANLSFCPPSTDPTSCYNGRQGYRASITTE